MIKLEHLTDLRLTIDPHAYLNAAASREGLWYLMNRLFSGERIAEDELLTWGLSVKVMDEFVAVKREEG